MESKSPDDGRVAVLVTDSLYWERDGDTTLWVENAESITDNYDTAGVVVKGNPKIEPGSIVVVRKTAEPVAYSDLSDPNYVYWEIVS